MQTRCFSEMGSYMYWMQYYQRLGEHSNMQEPAVTYPDSSEPPSYDEWKAGAETSAETSTPNWWQQPVQESTVVDQETPEADTYPVGELNELIDEKILSPGPVFDAPPAPQVIETDEQMEIEYQDETAPNGGYFAPPPNQHPQLDAPVYLPVYNEYAPVNPLLALGLMLNNMVPSTNVFNYVTQEAPTIQNLSLKKIDGNKEEGWPIVRYQCQRCSKTYKSFRWAKKHVCRVRKSTSTRVRCDDCGKYFKTTALLKKHQCTRITPAWCEYCNFMTNGAHVTDIPAAMRHSYGPEPALDLSKIRESLVEQNCNQISATTEQCLESSRPAKSGKAQTKKFSQKFHPYGGSGDNSSISPAFENPAQNCYNY